MIVQHISTYTEIDLNNENLRGCLLPAITSQHSPCTTKTFSSIPLASTAMGLQTSYRVSFSFKGLYIYINIHLNIKGYIYVYIKIYIYINIYTEICIRGVYNLKMHLHECTLTKI